MKFHRNGLGIVSLVPLDSKKLIELQRQAAGLVESLVGFADDRVCERVLDEFPDLRSHPEAVLELIYLEHVLRSERGHGATLAELQSRFPNFATDIERLMCVDEAMRHPRDGESLATVDRRSDPKTVASIDEKPEPLEESFTGRGPRRIGRYEILDVIGRGGMGIVYRARQQGLDRLVALKTLNVLADLDETIGARFESEARLAAKLQHNNIVRIYEIGQDRGTPFFSMELVSGGDLAQATRHQSLDAQQAARLLEVLARAVHYAHRQGVIHRDLKPANILLSPIQNQGASESWGHGKLESEAFRLGSPTGFDDAHFEPKIADFGLATSVTAEVQKTEGGFQGTPSYMAPELMDTRKVVLGPSCDVYSLGAILYDTLAGRPPFQAPTIVETIHQVISSEPLPLRSIVPGLPRDLETICLKCLSKDPSHRYATALEFADDLNRFLSNRPILARRASMITQSWKWARRNPSLAGLIAAMFVATIGISWFAWQAQQSASGERRERLKGDLLAYGRQIALSNFELSMQNVKRSREHLAATDPTYRQWEWDYLDRLTREPYWESSKSDLPIMSVAISPDGKYVAGGYGIWAQNQSEPIRVWNVESNELVWELNQHPSGVCDLVFSQDGRWLLSTGAVWSSSPARDSRREGGAILWNLANGEPMLSVPDIDGKVCRFAPDGESFLVGNFQGQVFEYTISEGKPRRRFQAGRSMVLDIVFDGDGKRMLISNRDGNIVLFDYETGRETHRVSATGDPRNIAWRPRSESFTVGKWGGEMQEYIIEENGLRPMRPTRRSQSPHLSYSPDGLSILIAVAGESIELRDSTNDRVLRRVHGLSQHIRSMAMDRFGRRVAVGHADGRIGVWDLTYHNRKRTEYSLSKASVEAISLHPKHSLLAIATGINDRNAQQDSGKPRIDIVDLGSGRILKTLLGHKKPLTCVEYDSSGEWLISGSEDQTVRVWDSATGKPQRVSMQHESPVVAAKFIQQTQSVLSGDRAGELIQWNRDTGDIIRRWTPGGVQGRSSGLAAFDVTSDGKQAIVATIDGELSVWNLSDGRRVSTRSEVKGVQSLSIDPIDGKVAIGFDNGTIEIVTLIDLMLNPKALKKKLLHGHDARVHSLAWSPNGERLVTASLDQAMKLFDVIGGVELLTLDTSREEPMYVAFHENGQQIVRASNQQVCLWNSKAEWDASKDSSHDRMVRWHSDRLNQANRAFDTWARLENATALIELQPDNWRWYFERATARTQFGEFAGAREDLQQSLALEDRPTSRSLYARTLLALGDLAGYRKECRRLWDQVKVTSNIREINGAVWTFGLTAECGVPSEEYLPIIEKVATEESHPRFKNTLALAYYRAGRIQEAIEMSHISLKTDQEYSAPFDWIILALCHGHGSVDSSLASRKGASERWLRDVEEWIRRQEKLQAASKSSSQYYKTKMSFEIPHLLREARSKASGEESKTGWADTSPGT